MITGLKTFSSKLPCEPAKAIGGVVAHHLHAHHRHRLALRRVHLARHDRRARLVLRQRQLAQAAARARRPASGCRWRSSSASTASVLSAPLRQHQRVVRRPAPRIVRAPTMNGRPVSSAILLRHALGELRVRVQPGADRRAAERQLVQAGQRPPRCAAGRGRAGRRSRRIPGRASAAPRPSGACGRS